MVQAKWQKERGILFLSFQNLTNKKPNAIRNNTFLPWKSLKSIIPFHCQKMEILTQAHVPTVLEI